MAVMVYRAIRVCDTFVLKDQLPAVCLNPNSQLVGIEEAWPKQRLLPIQLPQPVETWGTALESTIRAITFNQPRPGCSCLFIRAQCHKSSFYGQNNGREPKKHLVSQPVRPSILQTQPRPPFQLPGVCVCGGTTKLYTYSRAGPHRNSASCQTRTSCLWYSSARGPLLLLLLRISCWEPKGRWHTTLLRNLVWNKCLAHVPLLNSAGSLSLVFNNHYLLPSLWGAQAQQLKSECFMLKNIFPHVGGGGMTVKRIV